MRGRIEHAALSIEHLMYMKNSVQAIAAMILSLLPASTVLAQPRPALTGTIPFEFTVNGKSLNPGTYRFYTESDTAHWLTVAGETHKINAAVVTRLASNPGLRDATLVFDVADGKRHLSEVWIPGQGGLLVHATPKGHDHETLIAVQSGLSGEGSGREVFAKTCARCHGANGDGNEAADRFFQTKLPRLNSEYVQAKSDAELREIITQGRRKMDPVRIGQSTVQHLLPSESIDSVLAYLRSLKAN